MVFCHGSKNLGGEGDSFGKLGGELQLFVLGEGGGVGQRRAQSVTGVGPVIDLEGGDCADPLVGGGIVSEGDSGSEIRPASVVLVR